MPLTPSTSRRALKHTRAIQIEAFARDDGLWDIDAHITDIKPVMPGLLPASNFNLSAAMLRSGSAAVARYDLSMYPHWAVKPQAVSKST